MARTQVTGDMARIQVIGDFVDVNNTQLLKRACAIHLDFTINRYLIANTFGRWNGNEKASRHREMCMFYVALRLDVEPEKLKTDNTENKAAYAAIHRTTQLLTDYLDESIGFPVDTPSPDYDRFAKLFFERFHTLAMTANIASETAPEITPDIITPEMTSEITPDIAREIVRKDFEADAALYGFDLDRFDRLVDEPWNEYVDIETGHRWAGWLACLKQA